MSSNKSLQHQRGFWRLLPFLPPAHCPLPTAFSAHCPLPTAHYFIAQQRQSRRRRALAAQGNGQGWDADNEPVEQRHLLGKVRKRHQACGVSENQQQRIDVFDEEQLGGAAQVTQDHPAFFQRFGQQGEVVVFK